MSISPMLALHICGGTVGTLSGFVAVAFRKGSRRHAIAGKVFVISMIALAASGAFMAMMKFQPGNILGGTLTFYLVLTAWLTAKHRHGEKGVADWVALLIAICVAAFEMTFAIQAATSPTGHRYGYPPAPYLMFGTVALLAAAGDMRKTGALYFLTFLPLILLIFWLIRVKFARKFSRSIAYHGAGEIPAGAGK